MNECVPFSIRCGARFFVDEADILFLKLRHHTIDIVHFEAEVMHSLAAFGEIFGNA